MEGIIKAIIKFNADYEVPIENIKKMLSLSNDPLPQLLKRPIAFVVGAIILSLFILFSFSNIVYILLAVGYPLMVNSYLMKNKPTCENMIGIYHYWMMFGLITAIDTIFGSLLWLVPFYSYLKIAVVYLLVRDEFNMSVNLFTLLSIMVDKIIGPQIDSIERMLQQYTKKKN